MSEVNVNLSRAIILMMHRIIMLIVAVTLISLAIASVFLILVAWEFNFGVDAKAEPFNSLAWIEKSTQLNLIDDPGCVRGGMALDLINKDLLTGYNSNQIIETLGPPYKKAESKIYYELGQCSGLGWHYSVLVIDFKDSVVNELEILRDSP